jgi:GDP-4-dehydro-6-deoxy-D-mannose reductase
MNGKKALVTGACGFLGSNLVSEIKREAPKTIIYGADRNVREKLLYVPIKTDISDEKRTASLISEVMPDYIFHLAGTISTENWEALYEANIKTTVALLEAVNRSSSQARIVIVGSAAEYGPVRHEDLPISEDLLPAPVTKYGASMCCRSTMAMMYARNGLDVCVGRVFNIIGPGISDKLSTGAFAKQIAAIKKQGGKGTMNTGRLDSKRDFLDISDISNALYRIAVRGKTGEIYNICSGRAISIRDSLDIMLKQYPGIDISTPECLLRQNDASEVYGDNKKLVRDTGWKQRVTLEDGLKRTLEHYIGST